MKKKLLLIIAITVLLCISAAAEDTYVVHFNTPTLFSSEPHRNFCLATYDELQEYLAEGIVSYYDENIEIPLLEAYDGESLDWNLEAVRADFAWNIGCFGQGARVGVMDSGVYAHPTLVDNLVEGYNYRNKNTDTNDGKGHGTFVAGIIASVAPDVKIVPLKSFNALGTATLYSLTQALIDAVDVFDCDVVNMSFGMPATSEIPQSMIEAVQYALDAGCILVAAVGNEGNDILNYPACHEGVIGVGAIDKNGKVCSFSQRNESVDFVAPGSGVISVSIEGYTANSGTSFAAPHISALAAIARSVNKGLTSERFANLLEAVCKSKANYEYTYEYGHGAVKAVGMFGVMLSGKKAFVSPMREEENGHSAVIYNPSTSSLDAVAVKMAHKNGMMQSAELLPLSLSSKEVQKVYFSENARVGITVWENLVTMKPLTVCRKTMNN